MRSAHRHATGGRPRTSVLQGAALPIFAEGSTKRASTQAPLYRALRPAYLRRGTRPPRLGDKEERTTLSSANEPFVRRVVQRFSEPSPSRLCRCVPFSSLPGRGGPKGSSPPCSCHSFGHVDAWATASASLFGSSGGGPCGAASGAPSLGLSLGHGGGQCRVRGYGPGADGGCARPLPRPCRGGRPGRRGGGGTPPSF